MPVGITELLVRSFILLGEDDGGENSVDDFWSHFN